MHAKFEIMTVKTAFMCLISVCVNSLLSVFKKVLIKTYSFPSDRCDKYGPRAHCTACFSHCFYRKLKLTCRVLLHDFPAVANIFHVQPVGVCRSCDLLTDRSRRLTSALLCKYLNAKALRFKVGVFYG
jgi:hypothetical protein